MSDSEQTPADPPLFDFGAYPANTLFYDRRTGLDRRANEPTPTPKVRGERRARKDRRRRVDPTTFEKQYTVDEMEFMTAMQNFKIRTGKSFPTYGEVLTVATQLGYRQTGIRQPIVDLSDQSAGENPC